MSPAPTGFMIVGFLAAAAVGWTLADSHHQPAQARESQENHRGSSRHSRPDAESGPPASATASLAAIGNADDSAGRMRAVIALANSIPDSEVARWLEGRWFPKREGFEPVLFTELLLRRWERLDPVALARWRMQDEPGKARDILIRLARTDPAQAIAILKEHPSIGIEVHVLAEMATLHPQLALDRFLELALGRTLGNWAESDPTPLFDALATTDPGTLEAALERLLPHLRARAEDALAGQRLEDSFATEIRKLWDHPDGWMRFHNNLSREGFIDKLIGELPNLPASWRQKIAEGDWVIWRNPERWLQTDLATAGFSSEQARRIHVTALEGMARTKPETAIGWLDATDLDGEDRTRLVEGIFLSGGRSPERLTELLDLLTTGQDRETAARIIERRTANSYVPLPPVNDPAEWLKGFGAAEPQSNEVHQYRNMLHSWEPARLVELGNRLRALPEEVATRIAGMLAEQSCEYDSDYQPALHGEALRCLANHPDQFPDLVGKASVHATKWAVQDPAAASAWVESLPSGDAKQWARKNLAACWRHYDPDAADRWIGTLPGSEQSALREFLK